ncbi:MAG TPA: zinc-dependent alcohol dehydrogenase family protein [Actinomycetota bacterium]|nr:zinc-dependent alcohol dehydrogenase family protein [Actinomycetota bacterium]
MRAMVLEAPGRPLERRDLPDPEPAPGQVLVDVHACAVCRTDLHIIDGDLAEPTLPLVPGHQVVGTVAATGRGVDEPAPGDLVGVPWLGWTCGACAYCTSGRENLCPDARFTGYDLDGGFAERLVADARYCLPIPTGFEPVDAAPLLCAGLIGYRALRFTGDAGRVGLYGFGNAARLVAQVALHQGRELAAFTRPGDLETQRLALDRGCAWAGDSTQAPPEPLDAAIVFAAVGELVPLALAAVAPGGSVVCAEIHMSDIPSFAYDLLWRERVLRSVANLTRADGVELLALAAEIPLRTDPVAFPLELANDATGAARGGGTATPVLVPR